MQKHINSLTGLRGIAALWVVALHGATYVNMDGVAPAWLSNLVGKGWIGVDLFFVLSGFVIAYVHQAEFRGLQGRIVGRFLLLRLARIYPAHVVATLVLVPIVLGGTVLSLYSIPPASAEGYGLDRLVHSLTLTVGWGIPHSGGWNWPAWSVGSEWFAYLTFPVLAVLLNRGDRIVGFVGAIVATIAAVYLAAFLLNDGRQYMSEGPATLLRVMSAFFVGCCVYNIHARLSRFRHAAALAAASLAAIAVLACLDLPAILDGLFLGFFAILVAALARAKGRVAGFLGSRIMMYLGAISYSIYLSHYTVLIVANKLFELTVERAGLLTVGDTAYLLSFYAVYGLGSIAAGHLLFSLVEQPARGFIRDRWLVDKPAGAAETSRPSNVLARYYEFGR